MRWTSKTLIARQAPKKEWHVWFAWYPIVLKKTGTGADGRFHTVWLGRVLRRMTDYNCDLGASWQYRKIES